MTGFALKSPKSRFEIPRKLGSLYQVAPDIACLSQGPVNCYFLGEPGAVRWVLVDAGLPGFAGGIRRAAEERFGPGSQPAAIVLTHGHFDHVGGLRDLLQHWNVEVFAHRMELPFLTGRSPYPPADPTVGGGLLSWFSGFFPTHPIVLGSHVHALPNDGSIPELPGWRWLHTPGHTPGHISLFRDADRAMLSGDAFTTLRHESFWAQFTRFPELHGPPAYSTTDWLAARESLITLAALNPLLVAPGHGFPLRGHLLIHDLRHLAAHFDRIVRPGEGRYVVSPVVANLSGLVRIPPPVQRPVRNFLVLSGLVLATLWLGSQLVRSPRN